MNAVYDGYTAGTWAYNNYNNYDPAFPAFIGTFGSDCTNFVSQAMWHGGKAMAGDWYIYKKNSTYQFPNSAPELNYSWTLSDPSPWISVKEFNAYWRPKSVIHAYNHSQYVTNHATAYRSSIFKGDVVVFHRGVADFIVLPSHVMIISGYDATNQDFLLAGHSNNRQALPLLSAISGYSYIEFFEIP
ncbi:amidase domain-containing protein [Tumebacillus sp. BK434]|uniref:amidase domain-containing protein n=1 Tax=Tumebacillus sp. BK434 TaxID=2512169 RepID=UPI001FB30294|nr:amidase domain-containing protein [Tumebacillus sp. BK434]